MVVGRSEEGDAAARSGALEQGWLQSALRFHQQGRLAQADHLYVLILISKPDHVQALHHRGMIARRSGALLAAEQFLVRALLLRSDVAPLLSSYGLVLHDLNRFEEALSAYDRAILLAPDFSLAYYNQGVTLERLKRFHGALVCYDRAVALQPDHADSHTNRGNRLQALGRFEESLGSYDKAILANPEGADTFNNRGVALKDLGRMEEALASYDRAVSLNPGFVAAWLNRGVGLQKMGHCLQALASFDRAIALQLDLCVGWFNRGAALEELRRSDEALSSYARALAINPGDVDALNNHANVLQRLLRFEHALCGYDRALALCPDVADLWNNRGVTLREMRCFDEALLSFRKAVVLMPDHVASYGNLGLALKGLRRFDEALACYDKALILDPLFAEAHNNRGVALQDLTRFDEAMESFQHAITCEGDHFHAHSNLLFTLNYVGSLSVDARVAEARRFGASVARKAGKSFTSWLCPRQSDKLRIGFVSGDFCNHPVGYFLEGLLSKIDQNKFDLFAYSTIPVEDDLTQRLKRHVPVWRRLVNGSDAQAARLVHGDGLHVLIDLAGHTAGNRLAVFAHRPAPVQASWLGYFATTGMAEIDFFIGDPHVAPVAEEAHFVERIIRLPETYFCFTPPQSEVRVGALPALANGHVTFGCFNNLAKLNARVVAVWAEVLKAVEGSRLFLKSGQLGDPAIVQSTISLFMAAGVAPDRLLLEGPSSRTDYFEAFNRVDIALDPFPFPGGTTSVEGLWMGVPVITLRGDRFIAHNGETIAQNAGQADWIARDEGDYIRKAVSFSSDLAALAKLRRGLREQVLGAPLFASERFARHFERLMVDMWDDYLHRSGAGTSPLRGRP